MREEIIGALPVEEISNELQRQKAERLGRSAGNSEIASTDFPSGPPSTIDDDRASLSSFQSGSYVHASQMAESSFGEGRLRSKKTKVQLWYDMKINCKAAYNPQKSTDRLTTCSHHPISDSALYPFSAHPSYPHPTESSWSPDLSFLGCHAGYTANSSNKLANLSRK